MARTVIVTLLGIALLASSCGGSGSEDEVGASSIEEANQVCSRYADEVARLGDLPPAVEAFTSTGEEGAAARAAVAEYGASVRAAYGTALKEIRQLEPPVENDDDWREWMGALGSRAEAQRDQADALHAFEAASSSGDSAEADAAQQRLMEANDRITAALQRADGLARELGATRCAGVI